MFVVQEGDVLFPGRNLGALAVHCVREAAYALGFARAAKISSSESSPGEIITPSRPFEQGKRSQRNKVRTHGSSVTLSLRQQNYPKDTMPSPPLSQGVAQGLRDEPGVKRLAVHRLRPPEVARLALIERSGAALKELVGATEGGRGVRARGHEAGGCALSERRLAAARETSEDDGERRGHELQRGAGDVGGRRCVVGGEKRAEGLESRGRGGRGGESPLDSPRACDGTRNA